MAKNPQFMNKVLSIFTKSIFAWQRRKARGLGVKDGKPGAITFVQRFGSILNLNPHFHNLHPDGVFTLDTKGRALFIPLKPPTDEDVLSIVERISCKVERLMEKYADEEAVAVLEADPLETTMNQVAQEQFALTAQVSDAWEHPVKRGKRCGFVRGYSLHANRALRASNRQGLEKLCRYGIRPAFSQKRLSLLADGRVCYVLKRPWPNDSGITHLVMEPVEFLRKLVCLIPPPKTNLTRYHGVFAPNSKMRKLITPQRSEEKKE